MLNYSKSDNKNDLKENSEIKNIKALNKACLMSHESTKLLCGLDWFYIINRTVQQSPTNPLFRW